MERIWLRSLVDLYNTLGLPEPVAVERLPEDVSKAALAEKIVQPKIALVLGGEMSIEPLTHASWAANTLDAFFETGRYHFLEEADCHYQSMLASLPEPARERVSLASAIACNFFYYEQDVRRRIKEKEFFAYEEVVEYFLRRGSDSVIYAAILAADGIVGPAITFGFRCWQALWDTADDILDLEHDRRSTGVNVLLMADMTRRKLKKLADNLFRQARTCDMPKPLFSAIEVEYARTNSLLCG